MQIKKEEINLLDQPTYINLDTHYFHSEIYVTAITNFLDVYNEGYIPTMPREPRKQLG